MQEREELRLLNKTQKAIYEGEKTTDRPILHFHGTAYMTYNFGFARKSSTSSLYKQRTDLFYIFTELPT